MSNGRANNSNVYSNASNCFSSRFNGFLTIYKRFEPLNVKALVYVFPWKVTIADDLGGRNGFENARDGKLESSFRCILRM